MIIIHAAGAESINPFFPLLTKAHRPVRVVPWALYQKTLIPFTIIGGCLCCYGISMMRAELYSDGRFEILAFANLCFAFVRTMRFRKTSSIYVAPDLALQKISWLADLDFALCFSSFGIGAVVAVQNGEFYVESLSVFAIISFLFAIIPGINSVAVYVRKTLRFPVR